MAGKKKAELAVDTLVAAASIAIEGKHFDAGAPIEGVSEDETRRAVAVRRVVTFAEFAGKAEPEPEPEPEPVSTEETPEA